MKKIILGSSERIVMELLWERSPQTMMELYHKLSEDPGWSKSTVNTMLTRMREKNLVRYEQGVKAKFYEPNIEKKDADIAETENLIDRIYDGSVSMMMSALVKQKRIDKEELSELKQIIESM
jgi:predicted transcriptional regulator